MYRTIFPSKDATLYSRHIERNTGADAILELTKVTSGSAIEDILRSHEYWDTNFNTRMLLDFNMTATSASIAAGTITNARFYLTLKATEATNLPISYTLMAHPLSGSWSNGTGFYNNDPEVTNGVSWRYKDGKSTGLEWETWGADFYTTASYEASQVFSYEKPDIRIEVTPTVNAWISGSLTQHGFIIKHTDGVESGSQEVGSLKFFSKDTHTVYIPRLEVFWDDVDVSGTGSISEISGDDYIVYSNNMRESYFEEEVTKIRFGTRTRFPARAYSTSSAQLTTARLPFTSFYQIMDSRTDEVIIPFDDNGTRVSCDTTGNYITLDMNSFLAERFYKVIFKVETSSGAITNYVDDGFWFKVKRK